jgi:signal transduction histidine kinase
MLTPEEWMDINLRAFDREIEFGFRKEKGIRILFVKDRGVGFDVNHAGRIFQPFERLQQEQTYDGTGMGLAFVSKKYTQAPCQHMGGEFTGERRPILLYRVRSRFPGWPVEEGDGKRLVDGRGQGFRQAMGYRAGLPTILGAILIVSPDDMFEA